MRINDVREAIVSLETRMDRRFEQLEQRLDQRFSGIDQRFASIDQRFIGIDQRLDGIDYKFGWMVGLVLAVLMGLITVIARQ